MPGPREPNAHARKLTGPSAPIDVFSLVARIRTVCTRHAFARLATKTFCRDRSPAHIDRGGMGRGPTYCLGHQSGWRINRPRIVHTNEFPCGKGSRLRRKAQRMLCSYRRFLHQVLGSH
jgi:hypothetical protein